MNEIKWQLHDRLTTGEVKSLLGMKSYQEVKTILQKNGLREKHLPYGRSFTIKYSELVKVGLVNESNS